MTEDASEVRHPQVVAHVAVGRQPIFDARMKLVGYELLFRPAGAPPTGPFDGSRATAQVLYSTLEIGADDLLGDARAFINFPRELLLSGVAEILPPSRLVIEILETERIDRELIECVDALVARGYTIALDDFVMCDQAQPLLRHAPIVKLDVLGKSVQQVAAEFEALRPFGVQTVAEKVESQAEYDQFVEIGFTHFQGYFFARPRTVTRQKLPDNHVALLQLLAVLQSPNISIREVEHLVSKTVALNYKLFRYINSAFFGLARRVDSIQRAIVYFGLERVKQLATLIALTGIEDKPSELVLTGLTRARMCELLARASALPDPEAFFVVGLFSILDALLDMPLTEILGRLPLGDDAIAALLAREGQKGEALACSVACEQCRWTEVRFAELCAADIHGVHREAMIWARTAMP
jgi:EAL and modified HD-GYP domain-containing signal transduction protein